MKDASNMKFLPGRRFSVISGQLPLAVIVRKRSGFMQ
jgi:hypothetical protein